MATINGTLNDDLLKGGKGDDNIFGHEGNDTLIGGAGADLLDGGDGNDTADYSDSLLAVSASLAGSIGFGAGDSAGDTYVSIENLTGSDYDDLLIGDGGVNILIGGDGADTLIGYAGADTLLGGSGDDFLNGGFGADILDGGTGIDTVDYSEAGALVMASLASGSGWGPGVARGDTLIEIENVTGSVYDDLLIGDGQANVLNGGAGNDVLRGVGGSDTLIGGDGDDTMIGGFGADSFDGGLGNDTVDYSGSIAGVSASLTTGTGWGNGVARGDTFTSIEILIGSSFDDLLIGDGLSNMLVGGVGNDVLHGYQGIDLVQGGDGDDYLTGGAGEDTLDGGNGADSLVGGEDDDILTGGAGDDYFFFNDLTGNDAITDFTAGLFSGDVVDITNFGFDGFQDVAYSLVQDGSDVLLQLDADDSIRFQNTWTWDFEAGDFITGNDAKVIDLGDMTAADGFAIQGEAEFDYSGVTVSNAGDVNGDGFDDLIIGSRWADGDSPYGGYDAGTAYVVFGQATVSGHIDLAELSGSDGFKFTGVSPYEYAGEAVSGAGDINGDGFDDLLVSGPYKSTAYYIYGKAGEFSTLDTQTMTSPDGGLIYTEAVYGAVGYSMSDAGDVNGDGIDDIIVGAPYSTDGSNPYAGEAYVIYGKNTGFGDIDVSTLSPADGFRILGVAADDLAGSSVSSAGDVNGDGFDDLIIGAGIKSGESYSYGGGGGGAYVVFGTASAPAEIDLAELTSTDGFEITDGGYSEYLGTSVSSVGDVNGDGYDDLVVGTASEEAYLVFGKASGFSTVDFSALNPGEGLTIYGDYRTEGFGESVSAAGDVNGDGLDDIIIGARGETYGGYTGRSYVIYGKEEFLEDIEVAFLTASDGIVIDGGMSYDSTGYSVSGGGDINGDGFDDLIVGAPATTIGGAYGDPYVGTTYVVYGGDFTGSVTHLGTSAHDILTGSAGDDIIVAGLGDDVIIGGAGNDRMTGAGGNDTFLLADGDGSDVLVDFAGGAGLGDVIDLSSFGFADFTALQAAMSENLGDTLIQLDLDDSVLLEDTAMADLAADDFVFV